MSSKNVVVLYPWAGALSGFVDAPEKTAVIGTGTI
jgi:hypothetical protein